eukprot:CAMPEP_0117769626 /NCGR_PEP_ID=MMETSP0947-20121206/23183_1 /TAXON_ID=44440 /ORGANISM="Chattonella subsalsa, Strain CCMP2191" /LENGTH=110 /DNA_ID=CAMNT_0005594235 /DNA_START=105 /DNA_END=433 /DNA_ORIENTATION=-
MAFAQPRRINRSTGPSASHLSPRRAGKKHHYLLSPKEKAIVEAQRKREAREKESGWNSRFSIAEPGSKVRGGGGLSGADLYAQAGGKKPPRRRRKSKSNHPGMRQAHHQG